MDMLRLTWDAAIVYCERLAAAIDFRPDVIVGISRGGLVPARVLSDIMGVGTVGILGIVFYKGVGKTAGAPRITQELTMDLAGKKVLIVDDVADSGRSLAVAKEYVMEKGAREVRAATIHYKPGSIFKPDYFVAETTAWIVYPWEAHETEREFKAKKKKNFKGIA